MEKAWCGYRNVTRPSLATVFRPFPQPQRHRPTSLIRAVELGQTNTRRLHRRAVGSNAVSLASGRLHGIVDFLHVDRIREERSLPVRRDRSATQVPEPLSCSRVHGRVLEIGANGAAPVRVCPWCTPLAYAVATCLNSWPWTSLL